jgi:hypothetical protein
MPGLVPGIHVFDSISRHCERNEATQSSLEENGWIASSLRSSQ